MNQLTPAIISLLNNKIKKWEDWQYYLPISFHIREIIDSFNYWLIKVENISKDGVTYVNSKKYTYNSNKFQSRFDSNQIVGNIELVVGEYYLVHKTDKWNECYKLPFQDIKSVKTIDLMLSSLFNLAYNKNIPNVDYSDLRGIELKSWIKFSRQQEKLFENKGYIENNRFFPNGIYAWELPKLEPSDIKNTLSAIIAELKPAPIKDLEELRVLVLEAIDNHTLSISDTNNIFKIFYEIEKAIDNSKLINHLIEQL